MSKVKTNVDLIQWLGRDMSIEVFSYLDSPRDLVRASAVSSSWNDFVIENALCKRLCLKMIPEISAVVRSIEGDNMIEFDGNNLGYDYIRKREHHKRNHRVYAILTFGLIPMDNNCISQALSASSTNNPIKESLTNTLEPSDIAEHGLSYWSSIGQRDPSATETLLYRLCSKICLVTDIHVQPFQDYTSYGIPIYSAKAIRFRLGGERDPMEIDSNFVFHDEKALHTHSIWTYTSPVFPMSQENKLQHFKLPEPVLCIGGLLLVELLGSVQESGKDSLFYICISHVKVVGRILSPEIPVRTRVIRRLSLGDSRKAAPRLLG